jgi:UDP-GlcNAc:undecaprenyl-phosphate/decaprenyl-phosphate GlcNAc-1-phosphate transferase
MRLLEHALLGLAVGGPALLLAACSVPFARRAARRMGALDEPGQRKLHESTMPRTGGIAVYVAFVATVGIGYFLLPSLREEGWLRAFLGAALDVTRDARTVQDKLVALLAGATIAFATGFADDVLGRRFPVAIKVLGQLLAAGVVMSTGVRASFMPTEWLNWLATLLWLVGITNAFNLLDNMDGLAAGVAFVASGVLLLHAWALGEFLVAVILLAFMGSLLGFLFFNFHPASVFLGDCGSHFIGFVMASIMLLERYVTRASSTLFPLLMPVLLLAVPLIDTATVILIRLREGRPIYVGDQRHLSHRLLALGFTQRSAALFLYLATFCLGVGALLLPHATVAATLLILLQAAGFVALILFLMFLDRRPAAGSRIE